MSDDLSHDTHLRAALRHAPDHALAPPAGVSQTILNAARQVHRPVRAAVTPTPAVRITVARPRALEWLRQLFASPRLAGGLATGLVAALGLGLWLDLEREPVIERAAAPAAERPTSTASRADAGPSAEAPPATATPPATAPATTAQPAPETARAKRAAPPTDGARMARKAESQERRGDTAARPEPPPGPAPAAERREAEARNVAPELAKSMPPVTPAPAPAPRAEDAAGAHAARDAAAPASTQPNPQAPGADASARSDLRMSLAAGRAAAAAAPAVARASAAEMQAAVETIGAAASPAVTLLRRARAEQAAGSARWSWTPPGSPLMAPFDEAGMAWLTRVVQATRGRWTDVSDRGSGEAIELRWWRDDWPQATLRIEADGLRWIEHGGRIRHAPLDAASLQRLRGL